MPKQGESVPQANRRIRQEALRDQLSNQKLVEKVIDSIGKIESLDPESPAAAVAITQQRAVIDSRMKLIAKYLPDLKALELTGEGGDSIKLDTVWDIEVHEVKPDA